jgi:Fe-S-cluster containining protein
MVNITPEEYSSGLYGEYAVKLTHQDAKNLGSGRFTQLATMRMPTIYTMKEGESQYFLEGPVGTPCPMLQEDGKCGIYEKRPITCRTYTCVGDDRITQDMRDGKVNIEESIMNWMIERAKNS